MMEGSTLYEAYGGTAKIENLVFTGNPGSSFKFTFEGDGIDSSKPSNQ